MATARTVYRDFSTDGVPSSGKHKVKKADVRTYLTGLETIINAFTSSGGLVYLTQVALYADLAHGANSMAWVVQDSDPAKNGVYQKIGASGAGSWPRVADLPHGMIYADDVGAGTPNSIQATTNLPITDTALVLLSVFEANSASPVTVSLNGGDPLTIKTATGADIPIGALTGGMGMLGRVVGSTFRMLSDASYDAVMQERLTATTQAKTDALTASETSQLASMTAISASIVAEAARSNAQAAAEVSGVAKFFDTYSAAEVELSGLSDGQIVEISQDETRDGLRQRYIVVDGTLVWKLTLIDENSIKISPAENTYLAAFARRASIDGDTNFIYLCSSIDGKAFKKINSRLLRSSGVEVAGYDPSIIYHRGWYLVAVSSYAAGVRDVRVFRSRDLLTWERIDRTFGATAVCGAVAPGGSVTCEYCWAPEWYRGGDDLYLLISLQTAANFTDIDGRDLKFFRPYYVPVEDFDTLTLGDPIALSISGDAGCKIDAMIISFETGLVMAVKDENDKKIEFYTGAGIDADWTFLSEGPTTYCEGPCITKTPAGSYRIYVDDWDIERTLYYDTDDFETFTAPSPIQIDGRHRHGTVHRLDEFDRPERVATTLSRMGGLGGYPIRDGAFMRKGYSAAYAPGTRLLAGSSILAPMDGYCYFVSSSDIANLTLGGSEAERFYLSVSSRSASAGITIADGDYYEALTGAIDYFGFGLDRDAILEFVRGADTQKFQFAGSRDRLLGYFAWASRPDATLYSGYEIIVTDLGAGYARFISNGTRWVALIQTVLARGTTNTAVNDSLNTKQTLATYAIPAGLLVGTSKLKISTKLQVSATDTDAKTFTVELGGTVMFSQSLASYRAMLMDAVSIEAMNSAVAQRGSVDGLPGGGLIASTFRTAAVDMATAQNLTLNFQYGVLGSGSKEAVLMAYQIDLIPG